MPWVCQHRWDAAAVLDQASTSSLSSLSSLQLRRSASASDQRALTTIFVSAAALVSWCDRSSLPDNLTLPGFRWKMIFWFFFVSKRNLFLLVTLGIPGNGVGCRSKFSRRRDFDANDLRLSPSRQNLGVVVVVVINTMCCWMRNETVDVKVVVEWVDDSVRFARKTKLLQKTKKIRIKVFKKSPPSKKRWIKKGTKKNSFHEKKKKITFSFFTIGVEVRCNETVLLKSDPTTLFQNKKEGVRVRKAFDEGYTRFHLKLLLWWHLVVNLVMW